MTNNVKAAKAAAEAMKANALIDDAVAAEAKLTNHETARAALIEKAEAYGAAASEGDMSQTKVAFLFNQAVREGVMTEEDAGKIYLAYSKGYNAARVAKGKLEVAGTSYDVHGDSMSDAERGKGAEKTAVSIFRTFGRPAVVAQGLDLYRQVRELRELLGADDRAQASLFNAFVAVNRAVSKAADESEKPDTEYRVTDDVITKAITKVGGGKTDVEKLAALVAALGKLVKTGKFDDTIEQAAKLLANVKPKATSATVGLQTIVKADELGLAA